MQNDLHIKSQHKFASFKYLSEYLFINNAIYSNYILLNNIELNLITATSERHIKTNVFTTKYYKFE